MQKLNYTHTIVSVFIAVGIFTAMALLYTVEKPQQEVSEVPQQVSQNKNQQSENIDPENLPIIEDPGVALGFGSDKSNVQTPEGFDPQIQLLSLEEAEEITKKIDDSFIVKEKQHQMMADHIEELYEKIYEHGSEYVIDTDDFKKIYQKLTVLYADLTGNTNEEAVVAIPSGGTGGAFKTLVFAIQKGDVVLLDIIDGYKMNPSINKDMELVIQTPHYEEGDANCCPTAFDITTYHWDGFDFLAIQRERTILEEFEK